MHGKHSFVMGKLQCVIGRVICSRFRSTHIVDVVNVVSPPPSTYTWPEYTCSTCKNQANRRLKAAFVDFFFFATWELQNKL